MSFHRFLISIVVASFCVVALENTAVFAQKAEPAIDFNRDIRPILSNACFQCHGPDQQQRKAELRLDRKGDVFAKRDGSYAIVPGKPGESELLKRIVSGDPDQKMPPPDSGKQLSKQQISLVAKWIEQGAKWSKHWAFVAPRRPPVPKVKNQDWVRNEIDAFVLARLERDGLRPSPEAGKVTLLRRLNLDLVGLPPSIEEIDEHLTNENDTAFATQVQRLLKSPHYGERWGRHWLDAARYADSDGFEKDKPRFVWAYRDWVINALNRDLPYNQFIIEQIAGDLLPNPTQDQLVATGFLRNSMINEEGGIDPEQFRMEAMFDRMDAVGKSILGLTIQCCQCHDHKYDPMTQQEYYGLFAFLNNSHEANISVYSPNDLKQRADVLRQIHEIEADLRHKHPDWQRRMAEWEERAKTHQTKWTAVVPFSDDLTTGGQKYFPRKDGSLLAQGYAPTRHTANFRVKTDVKNITAFQLELLNDPNLPHGGPGRSIEGTAALTEFEVTAAPADAPGKGTKIKIVKATADINLPKVDLKDIYDDNTGKKRFTGPIAFAIDGDDKSAWGIDAGPERRNLPRKAVFVAEKPFSHPKGTLLTFHLSQRHGGWNSDDNQNHNLGRFRLSITTAPDAVADPLPKGVRDILSIPPEKRSRVQTATVFSYFRTTVPEWKPANDRIEELWKQHPEPASQLVLHERMDSRTTSVLARGNFLKPTEAVGPAVPSFLHALPDGAKPTRLTLARWLVDRRSPTAARAIVNRVWQSYFGIGLVSTSEDLGIQSEAASHPELLDWLAVEFMENGWRLKALHRLIVSSATYRQSSRITPESYARDPYNRLLTRGPRLRVEAEIVRDIALAVSGLLSRKVGGPPVYPPAPEFLFKPPASYGPKVWKESTGDDRYRRAVYTFRFRSVPYPALQAFDAPNGDFSCVRRSRSNTPLQALTTLNEPLFMECARALALRILNEADRTNDERIRYAFRLCLTRKPSEQEIGILSRLLAEQTQQYGQESAKPWDLAANDPKSPPKLPEGTTPADAAAWTVVARVLLNLDETITKQ